MIVYNALVIFFLLKLSKLHLHLLFICREEDLLFQLATPLTSKQRDSYHTNCVLIPQKLQESFKIEQTHYEQKLVSAYPVTSIPKAQKSIDDSVFTLARSSSLIDTILPEEHGQCSHHSSNSLVTFEKRIPNNEVPAWFGKGCRKSIKKKSKIKNRRQTN